MRHSRTILAVVACASVWTAPRAVLAQATVDYTDPAWQDFGNTNITSVMGNFLPGWTTLNGTPDIGNGVFFVPTQSLSGASDDAALWMLQWDSAAPNYGPSNENVELSLSGFTIGDTYQLDFFATNVFDSFADWIGVPDSIDITIAGANFTDFDTTILTDPIDADGLNDWVPQSIVFTAMNPIVSFDFGVNASLPGQTHPDRFGVDGFSMRAAPAPATALLVGCGTCVMTTRRRRSA